MIARGTRVRVAHGRLRRQGAAAALAMLACAVGCGSPDVQNVLLISIDSLRADRLGAYGAERDTSPRIDALAREGALFERAVSSSSWTLPAHAALFTGLDDTHHGVQNPGLALAPGVPTLAQRLSDAGFATGAVVSGPYLHPMFGLDRGFDEYLNCMSYLEEDFAPRGADAMDLNLESHGDVTGPCVVRRARDWMARNRDGRWLLFVHFWDVHYDYRAPPTVAKEFHRPGAQAFDATGFATNPAIHPAMPLARLAWLLGLYDAEVAYTDASVGDLLDVLDDFGLADSTLVVLVSDHGDAFFEHGRKGHQNDLHGESVSIPFILRGPQVPAGVRLRGPAHITDVAPTILDLLGESVPLSADGRSLGPALADPNALADRWVLSELRLGKIHHVALESADRKVMRDIATGETRAYDLKNDPTERRPFEPGPELSQRLDQRLQALARGVSDTPRPRAVPDLPAEVVERLRAMGYID